MKKKQFKVISGFIEIWKSKLFLAMKLTLIALCITVFQGFAYTMYGQNNKVNLKIENASIKQVLSMIEDQSNYFFIYNGKLVDVDRKITINIDNQSINDVLKEIFQGTNIKYEIDNRQILLSGMENVIVSSTQQMKNVEGKVTDSSGGLLPGVSVVIKGTTSGTITDSNGKFTLSNVPANAILIFSFVGMKTQEIKVENKSSINVSMADEAIGLEEVVAVGYGVQKKSNITGSIASVTSGDLQNRATENVGKTLQGKVSGVQVLSLSGAPGSAVTFRIRGYSNNSSSDPLYIVDGLKVTDISYLDPGNIASIEILKDAASAAIYGAEAGNGVVLISTKTGKSGTSHVFYNMQNSTQSQSSKIKMMDAAQFKSYWMQSGLTNETYYQSGNTDWQDEIFKKGHLISHNVGLSGGNDKGTYYVSLTYNNNNGMVVGKSDTYKRFTAQVNADYNFKPWLKVGTTNVIERDKTVNVSANGMTTSGSVIGGAYFYDPTVPAYYENDADAATILSGGIKGGYNGMRNDNGKLFGSSYILNSDLGNPLSMIQKASNESWGTNVNGTLYADIKPIKGLIYTSKVGYRIGNTSTSSYLDGYYWNASQNQKNGSLSASMYESVYVQWENFANYLFSFGKNDFTAMAGMRYALSNIQSAGGSTNLLNSDNPNYRYLSYSNSNATTDNVVGDNVKSANISYFGRLEWNYSGKYMLQASYRADAFDASKLAKNNRWGYFPAFSAGWVVTNENFMKNLDQNFLSFMKLRTSWGINGNINSLSGYPYSSTLSVGSTYYYINNTLVAGASPSNLLPNLDLTWEKSEQIDLGIETRYLNNRLTFAADFYRKITDGLLGTVTPPVVSGNSSMQKNLGKILNRGLEFELGWKDKIGDFTYSINGNLSTLHNEVLESPYSTGRKAGGGGFQTDATYFEKGYPIWYLRTYKVDHIDAATGQPIYKTAAELGTDDGKAPSGSGIPDFIYGLTVNLSYKGFDLRVSGSGQQGSELFFALVRPDVARMNFPEYLYTEGWTPTNTAAKYANSTVFTNYATAKQYGSSDAFVFNSSYFKIKEIQLGYTLPLKYTKTLKMSSLRVYTTLENFFTFTKYPGSDPETMAGTTPGSVVEFGGMAISLGGGMSVDRVQYPSMKQIIFGVNVSF